MARLLRISSGWVRASIAPTRARVRCTGREQRIRELRYGSNGTRLFLRVDLAQAAPGAMAGAEIRVSVKTAGVDTELDFLLSGSGAELADFASNRMGLSDQPLVECAYQSVFEAGIDLATLGAGATDSVRVQLSLWRDGLPLEAAPAQGWLEFVPGDPAEWE